LKFDVEWEHMISVATVWFAPSECFRRPKSKPINKALFDLVALAASDVSIAQATQNRDKFRETYFKLLENVEFEDLISRAVDHKKRTERRFALWQQNFDWLVN
jgi:hypothetical protein